MGVAFEALEADKYTELATTIIHLFVCCKPIFSLQINTKNQIASNLNVITAREILQLDRNMCSINFDL